MEPTPIRPVVPPPIDFTAFAEAPEIRDVLRERIEEEAEALWAIFADALAATTAAGRPDHRTRLLAARTLLAEVYPGGRVKDELAELRRRRGQRRAASG